MDNSYLRICRDCGLKAYTDEDLEDFKTAGSRYKYGKLNMCISCFKKRKKIQNRNYNLANREKISEWHKKNYALNREKIRKYQQEYRARA